MYYLYTGGLCNSMSLPDLCPFDEKPCKGKECHLYCVEWRTKEPFCMVGYPSKAKEETRNVQVQDTYASDTFKKLGRSRILKQKMDLEKAETPALFPEKKKQSFKPWPEFPPKNSPEKGKVQNSEAFPNESLKECETQNLKEKLSLKENLKVKEALRAQERQSLEEAANVSSRLEPRKKERILKTEPLEEKSPEFQEKVVHKDVYATLFSSVSEAEQPASSSSEKKPEKEQEKRKKLSKIMEFDIPENSEEEFWS